MHCSRRLQGGGGGRRGRGVSPLLRHSPVRAPPAGHCGDPGSAPPLPVPGRGPHDIYLGNWPRGLHEPEIAALFHKYSIYPTHIHLHRRPLVKSFAYVQLACAEDVARAVDQLHGGKVLGHQIVVQRRRPAGPPPSYDHCGDVEYCGEVAVVEEEEEDEPEQEAPPSRPGSPNMPPLVLPAPRGLAVRRHFSDRDEELYDAVVSDAKRVCSRPPGPSGDSGELSLDSGSGQHSARNAPAAAPELIRRRLHQPVDVLVANFPPRTAETDLMELFSRFRPLSVRVMVADPAPLPGDFTYAYVTVWDTMLADSAVRDLDGRLFGGHQLVVEVRRS